jgi:hypothetical protein
MEYVDDEQDIRESLKALDRIRDWAHQQMGDMRKPRDEMDESIDSPAEEHAEEVSSDPHQEPEEMEMPFDEPPPPDFGEKKKPKGMDVEIEVITPASRSRSGRNAPPVDIPSKDTVEKMDKFGNKFGKRRRNSY